jgi:vesicular inhibitory amino acid transporter
MKNPKQADGVCETAYAIAMVVYTVVSVCGYLMYGRGVSDEVGSKRGSDTAGFLLIT